MVQDNKQNEGASCSGYGYDLPFGCTAHVPSRSRSDRWGTCVRDHHRHRLEVLFLLFLDLDRGEARAEDVQEVHDDRAQEVRGGRAQEARPKAKVARKNV